MAHHAYGPAHTELYNVVRAESKQHSPSYSHVYHRGVICCVQDRCIALLVQGQGIPEERTFKPSPKGRVGVCWMKVVLGGDRTSQTKEATRPGLIPVSSFNASTL